MSDERPVREISMLSAGGDSPLGQGDGDTAPQSPYAAVARLLRGRWQWAIGLAGVLGAAGGTAGWTSQDVLYQSVGLIEVQPSVKRVLYRTEDSGVHPMFDAFLETQVALASSRRVIDMAMGLPAWTRVGRPNTNEAVALFQDRLLVARQARSQYIRVGFSDEDPDTAQAGATAVLRAYKQIVDEQGATSDLGRLRQLEDRRRMHNTRLGEIRREVQSVTEEVGAEGLEDRYKTAIDHLGKLDATLNDLDLEIASLSSAEEVEGRVLTEVEIALKDQGIAQLLQDRAAAEREMAFLREVEQLGDKEPRVVAAQRKVDDLTRIAAERLRAYREANSVSPAARAADLQDRKTKREQLASVRAEAHEQLKRLGKSRAQLLDLEAERTSITESLAEVQRRIDELNTETASRERIDVSAEGDRPVRPFKDKRLQMGLFGVVGGMALGLGLVLLWARRDARMRHVVDVDSGPARGRFLGILPDVGAGDGVEGDVAAAAGAGELADYSIHHVRTMLQLRSADLRHVVALTSPSAGAGKTTLSLALGQSYAAAGSRTLVVDCDLVGHGLTTTLRAVLCERATDALIGDVDEGLPPRSRSRVLDLVAASRIAYGAEQVAELLSAAREMARNGSAECERAARSLAGLVHAGRPEGTRGGIHAALDGAPLADCVLAVEERLSVLPVGGARSGDAERLSRKSLEHLIATCRDQYETVIIDTGPVLGSLESALVSSVADTVLLVVRRGEQRKLVDDALARLEAIGADVSGIVFNRATSEDVMRSSYASRSASRPAEVT